MTGLCWNCRQSLWGDIKKWIKFYINNKFQLILLSNGLSIFCENCPNKCHWILLIINQNWLTKCWHRSMSSLSVTLLNLYSAQKPGTQTHPLPTGTRFFRHIMMTSSNRNLFRVTGHLCGEFTGPRWIPRTKTSDAELWCFLWSAVGLKGWINNREAGDLRRYRVHYDVTVMFGEFFTHWMSGRRPNSK